jgi:hypothetical protein
MGAIGGLLGLNGGINGSGFSTSNPVNGQQIGQSLSGTQNSMAAQNGLLNVLQQQGGIQNQNAVYNQLQGVANGTGPNPAQAMLNQSTGQNVANQAALMAGQRGASGNVGLMARQAAQQGANTQQQSVGQGAAMQAQQSLGAIGQAGALATQQAQQQIGQTNQNVASQQGLYGTQVGAQTGYNQAQAGMESGQAGMMGGILGGAMSGLGSYMGMHKAEGGMIGSGPQSAIGKYAKGGSVPAMVSPGEVWLPPQAVKEVAQGKSPQAVGEKIGGTPAVPGAVDSYANDTVRKDLKVGGIVVPRSQAQSTDPEANSRKFVLETLAKRKK